MSSTSTPLSHLGSAISSSLPPSFAAPSLVSHAITQQPIEIQQFNEKFIADARPHALLITNHGYAGPKFPTSGPDSGGQITYVNELAEWLVKGGYKVTVATRSFAPDQEYAGYGLRRGVEFFAGENLARYVYVPGIFTTFLPKEQIFADLPAIGFNLAHHIAHEAREANTKPWDHIAWINSHYWDGGVVGQMLVKWWRRESGMPLDKLNRHSWNAHSIGTLKEDNMRREFNPETGNVKLFRAQVAAMNFPMREHAERGIVGGAQHLYNGSLALFPDLPPAAVLVWTSEEIRDHMVNLDIPKDKPLIHFPPGTDIKRYHPRTSISDEGVHAFFAFLEKEQKVPPALLTKMRTNPQSLNVIVEASRMDDTKRKHIVIKAMSYLPENTILFVTGKPDKDGIYNGLVNIIEELKLQNRVFLLGFVPDETMGPMQSLPHGTNPDQFNLAIGIGASRMEGWGMSVMDATAGGMPLIASDMTPYATFLRNKANAAVVIPVTGDEPQAYADAVLRFIAHPDEARAMANRSLPIARTLYWPHLIKQFLEAQGL